MIMEMTLIELDYQRMFCTTLLKESCNPSGDIIDSRWTLNLRLRDVDICYFGA